MKRRKTILSFMLILVIALSISVFVSAKPEVPKYAMGNPEHCKDKGWWRHVEEYWLPDLVLLNGKILTMDGTYGVGTIVGAVAIKDDKIVAVGHTHDIKKLIGRHTQVIDLHGKTVIPGLIDSHIHLEGWGMAQKDVQLWQLNPPTIASLLKAIGDRVAVTPPGEWVLAFSGWHEGQLVEKRVPTCWELDTVSPNNPVYIPRGGHVGVANSYALRLAGITKDTPDPPGGVIVRDPVTGEPNGMLLERAKALVTNLLPPAVPGAEKEAIKTAMTAFNKVGLTAACDPGHPLSVLKAYMDTWSNGELTMRMDVLIRDSSPNLSWALNYYRDFGDDMLKIGGLKFGMDGGVEGAYLKDPYLIVPGQQNDPNYHGMCSYPTQASQDALKNTWLLAAKNGWSVATHNVGDAAIEITLGLYEEVNKEVPLRDLRWRIEHLFLPELKDLDEIKNMGILITMQDHPVYLGNNMLVWQGFERASYGIPIRTVLNHGILVGGGTDAPAGVDPSPFTSMWWMVTRKTLTTDEPLGPDQAITIEEALRLYTINNAYIMHWEDKIGSIEPGKLADLVVLDTDILTCPPDNIKNIKVLKTMLGGKIVYEAP